MEAGTQTPPIAVSITPGAIESRTHGLPEPCRNPRPKQYPTRCLAALSAAAPNAGPANKHG
eukprot:10818800-Lingulodinium_polyedra.AAC.1